MRNYLTNRVAIEKVAINGAIPKDPCVERVSRGGGHSLEAYKNSFECINKQTQVQKLVLKCIKGNKSTQ